MRLFDWPPERWQDFYPPRHDSETGSGIGTSKLRGIENIIAATLSFFVP